ncbi:hypothetical protein CLORAM_02734 [Thomasclavelia ramosa DSM 1402]|uniref:Uncharacterized protein n=1 Tax=Thomasclavelia ramosa DSM 1402 TaxID=445974 RepID=B0N800_9FIRM|nr:hypothetical protein CLORAM_02734 [Thomasclavelia ramosa DSM 1402]
MTFFITCSSNYCNYTLFFNSIIVFDLVIIFSYLDISCFDFNKLFIH